jgi:hypothetical protein
MYPKDYFADAPGQIESGLCFVIMPFAPGFHDVWDTIRKTVSEPPFNLLCRRADDIALPGSILADVLSNIGRAGLIIAELTGQNPNVFYELGIAHTVKPSARVILLSADVNHIPFDLRHLKTVIYAGDHDRLRAGIAATLKQLGIRQYPLVLKEGETGRIPGRLTGADRCLYDIDITLQHAGDDGVKFRLGGLRYAVGSRPAKLRVQGYYLGVEQPAMKVPKLGWYLCYTRTEDGHVRFILGREPGTPEPPAKSIV